MRAVVLLAVVFAGCARPAADRPPPPAGKTAGVLAALFENASLCNQASLDPARRQAAADSVLKNASMTREEFLADVRALNADLKGWRDVSEETARILEQRLASRAAVK